ncbi:N-acetyl-gamma-glutamyl-phosphate reductase [Oscillibacter sp.]|uniref:N-acetyl-gamma-glutamyl-phosphate reductase n=1 Tax=Oscillibacter sp. TaxID=1945593 RepID=UPI0026177D39|nr:N-acetyl-gamma-glutamyl-phosphate reductase [Oscillibacter sp.]MDD3347110.1 N-acetyl-gamma-glutamyl-phosphate reductase [Oscillibacter sp.]
MDPVKPKVYIDGKDGTTGLQIYDRLSAREDVTLLLIDEEKRKDSAARKALMDAADLVFLCLPDAAAVEAVALVENPATRIIDASTAHRTASGWVYGFAELGQRGEIALAKRVANPGCHATGFLSAAAPLVKLGILPKDYPLTVYSLTGYSGGGKKMIAEYESDGRSEALDAPRIYGLNLRHKHLPEMQKIAGLSYPPVFNPVVDDYYKGMATTLLLHNRLLSGAPTAQDVCEALTAFYAGQALVKVTPFGAQESLLSANRFAGKDTLELTVCGNEAQTMITARFDNLGKGASGAAVQNMNLMLGFPETAGLSL